MVAIITVFIIVMLSMVVTRVATTMLVLTGMSRQAAKFQARSALTGAGFTTAESESIVNHPVRRQIIMTLMLIGSAGIVTVIAGITIGLVGRSARTVTINLLILVAGLAVLLWLVNQRPVDRALQRLPDRPLSRYTDIEIRDYASLLEVHGGFTISELKVEPEDWIAEASLADLRLSEEGVLVLGIQRPTGRYVGAPDGESVIHAGDVLVLYAHRSRLADLDVRRRGPRGDQQHDVATVDQRVRELREHVEDEGTIDQPDEVSSSG